MKKPHVLNRAMFNRGGTSAYGRGITSNLVTEEQRQKFNYGGRVRAAEGLYNPGWWKPEPFDRRIRTSPVDTLPMMNYFDNYEALPGTYTHQLPEGSEDAGEIVTRSVVEEIPEPTDQQLLDKAIAKDIKNEPENQVVSRSRLNRLEKEMNAGVSDDPGKEVMTDSDWMELLGPTEEQKKRTKGEAQLGLAAGALDVFSQPSIAKGMKAASPHLLNLGKTATADQKARDKAILQGKVLSKVYTDRAGAKGAADVETLKAKAKLIKEGDTPRNRYFAGLDSKLGMKKSMSEALGYPIQTVKKDKKGIPVIPEGTSEETIMWDTESGFMMLKDGNLVPVTETQIFGIAT